MRSYIFTRKERQIITGFFEGKVGIGDDIMRQVVHRLRTFRDLGKDVDLYLRLREAIAAKPT
jgi:hypothetical protein